MEYIKATINDISLLIDYRIEFMVEFLGLQTDEATVALRSGLQGYFSRALTDGSYICYLARENNFVVGIGGMVIREQPGNFKNPSGRVGYIMNMYTVPAFRRKGICSAILEQLIKAGREQGLAAFELHATKDGEPVYQKRGFYLHHEPTYRRFF